MTRATSRAAPMMTTHSTKLRRGLGRRLRWMPPFTLRTLGGATGGRSIGATSSATFGDAIAVGGRPEKVSSEVTWGRRLLVLVAHEDPPCSLIDSAGVALNHL